MFAEHLAAEREQGITIDVAYRYFSAECRSFIVADTPGRRSTSLGKAKPWPASSDTKPCRAER